MKNADWREYRNLPTIVYTKPEGKMSTPLYHSREDAFARLKDLAWIVSNAQLAANRHQDASNEAADKARVEVKNYKEALAGLEELLASMICDGLISAPTGEFLDDVRYTLSDGTYAPREEEADQRTAVAFDEHDQRQTCEDIDPASAESATREVLDNGN